MTFVESFGLWPSRLAIVIPLIGSIVQFVFRDHDTPFSRKWISVALVDLTAVLALIHFLAEQQYGCMFAADISNCFVSGLSSLFTALLLTGLSVLLILRLRRNRAAPELNHARLLIFVGALAGVTLGESLLVVIPALVGLYASLDYWLRNRGLRWGFLVIRDDYKDDIS